MDYNTHKSFPVEDRSYLILIKKYLRELSEHIELGDEERGKLDIIASEMTTNLIKYAHSGRELLVKAVRLNSNVGIELISLDKAPGIPDLHKVMEDGYSSSGTKGEGFGAIKRLSDEFDIYSQAQKGTITLSRVYKKKASSAYTFGKSKEQFEVKGVMIPMKGEEVCGDSWGYLEKDRECSIALMDGLGHGPHAHLAATEAVKIFNEHSKDMPAPILLTINEEIKKTRGAVGFIVNISAEKGLFTYCGVGNITCRVFAPDNSRTLISFNGILGLNVRRINNNVSAWDNGKMLILHSDGLATKWDISQYPGILAKDLSILATALYRDYSRQKDDVTVIVIRNKK